MNNDDYLLDIKTVQASTIKLVVDALKEILMDVNLEFDHTGMKIIAMDNTHIVLIHLKLEADKFERYFCAKKLSNLLSFTDSVLNKWGFDPIAFVNEVKILCYPAAAILMGTRALVLFEVSRQYRI